MKTIHRLVLLALACSPMVCTAEEDPQLVASRAIVQSLAVELQSALKGAIAAGGPIAAIEVCRDEAPRIAAAASRRHGAKVGRVSLKLRNPQNLADAWQQKVLTDFDSHQHGEGGVNEVFMRDETGVRYLSKIVTQELCTVCHGVAVSPTITARLAVDYPHDRATGYRVGDVRGAFSVVWPITAQTPD